MTQKKDPYDLMYKNFQWKIPKYYNFGFDVIDRWAEDRTKLALISLDRTGEKAQYHTFFDLKVLSNQFANILRDINVKKGDRVLVVLQNIPEWYVALIGMFKLGVIPIPGTTLLTSNDFEYRINRSKSCMVITDVDHADRVDSIRDNCPSLKHLMITDSTRKGWLNYDEEMKNSSRELQQCDIHKTLSTDRMLIYFTSGTTGQPKMVLHTHSYPLSHEITARFIKALTERDLHWGVSDTGWAKAAYGKLFGQMTVGAAVIQWDTPGRFNPDGLLRAMEKYGVTTFCAPPTAYRMIIQLDLSKYNLKLRHCMSAGEPLNPEVIRVWKKYFGLDIYDFYGQTETVCVLSNYSFMPIRYGSVGKPTPGHDVRIVDDDGKELNHNEEGNIALYLGNKRPPGLFKEYWKDVEIMKKSFRGDYYYTGDRGYKDKDGYFWFVGRDDDVIKSSGYRIGPFEVESALMEHEAVAECAVVGVSDPNGIRGIVVKAFIILAKGHTPSDELTKILQDHVKNVTAPYKYPRIIEYVEDLPKTISGKILRRELRKK